MGYTGGNVGNGEDGTIQSDDYNYDYVYKPEDFAEHGHQYPLPADVQYTEDHSYAFRIGQLVAAEEDRAEIEAEFARRNIEVSIQVLEGLGCLLVDFAEDPSEPSVVPELVAGFRGEREDGIRLDVSPNHVLFGASHRRPGAGNSPVAIAPLPPIPGPGAPPAAAVNVAVLDSGFYNPAFDDRVSGNEESEIFTPDLATPPVSRLRTHSGHGTFVAGLILQGAPGVTVNAVKVLGADGTVHDVDLALKILSLPVTTNIINISLCGETAENLGLKAVEAALTKMWLLNPNLVVVAAAGNQNNSTLNYPAAYKKVIAVTALNSQGSKACFANYGHWVDACARGVDLTGPFFTKNTPVEAVNWPLGVCSPETPGGPRDFKGWAKWSGTSFAAARLTGRIAAKMLTGVAGADAFSQIVSGRPPKVENGKNLGVAVD